MEALLRDGYTQWAVMVTLVKNEMSRNGSKAAYLKTTFSSESNAIYFRDLYQTVKKWRRFLFRHFQV
jgi:hypothetical protein